MTLGQSIRSCFGNYVTFSGRATRSEYWWFVLFVGLVSSALSAIDTEIWGPDIAAMIEAAQTEGADFDPGAWMGSTYGIGPFAGVWSLATFLPTFAAAWRRLHDTGRPGWMLVIPWLLMLGGTLYILWSLGILSGDFGTPEDMLLRIETFGIGKFSVLIGSGFVIAIVLLVFLCQASDPRTNRYGPPATGDAA